MILYSAVQRKAKENKSEWLCVLDFMSDNKHENYEILNLIGYGMAKFNQAFLNEFGFKTKTDFYEYTIRCGIADC